MLKRLFASTKNPYIEGRDRMERVSVDLSGCNFSLAMPPHMPDIREPKYCGPKLDIYQQDQYDRIDHLPDYEKGTIPGCTLFNREWSLQGKIFELGNVSLSCRVYRVDDLPEKMSCFNPVHFEQVIMRHLYFSHGPPRRAPNECLAPVSWQIKDINTIQWAYCEIHKNFSQETLKLEPGEDGYIKSRFFVPIDNQYYIGILFVNYSYSPPEDSKQAMYKLQNEIMATADLSLGQDQKQQQQQVAKHWPKAEYNKTRVPESWEYHQCRRGDPTQTIIKFGTPPPQYIIE